ncbi:MAG: D-alanyl-D-alanine carboxypeptidase family protein [Acetivibrionales bacterium]
MKIKSFTIYTIIIILITLSIPFPSLAEAQPDLTAKAFILMDMKTGQVLAEKNADERRSPASTTKIMTALVALENADLEDEMTASENAINSVPYDYVTAGIKIGETLKFKDLLDLMMITSANEASNIIAENISKDGTMQGFTDMMNSKAAELGLTGTHFTNANGKEEEDHYTTARDLAILSRAAMTMDKPIFREVVGRKEFSIPDTNLRKSSEWKLGHLTYTNELLTSHSKYYSKVTGIKTGYTDLAGLCLVSSAVNPDGLELIAVVLGAEDKTHQFKDSQNLLEYGFKNFGEQQLTQKGEYVNRFEVEDAVDGKKVEVITNNEFSHILPLDEEIRTKNLEIVKTFNEPFVAPIAQGQKVGKIEYIYDGKLIGTVELVAKEAIEKTTIAILRDKYKEIINDERFIFGVKAAVIVIVAIIILGFILRFINKRKRRRNNYYSSRKNNYRFRDYR